MSIPSPYSHSHSQQTGEPSEDCRDYLRTGRCKYGASCKYNHPSNVQSGGGMKAPINPSEPLFPVRPNEPVCQYYMKHGTCKFGQTCKFHHPSPSAMASLVADGGLAHAGGMRDAESLRLQWSGTHGTSSGDAAGGGGGFQLLPQRPGEPNCIFFLKNGKCKYGTTCRYHHPQLTHERRTAGDGRRYTEQNSHVQKIPISHSSRLQYITPLPANFQHGHFVVSEGAVAFVSIDPPSQQHASLSPINSSHRQVIEESLGRSGATSSPFSSSAAGTGNLGRSMGINRDLQSSASSASIASSSYDTTMSGAELQGQSSHGDPPASLWHRFNRNSSNTLSSFGSDHNTDRARSYSGHHSERFSSHGQNVGENINGPGMPAGLSNRSVSENGSVYYDAGSGSGPSTPLLAPKGVSWRGTRSSSFDHTRHSMPSRHDMQKSMSVPEYLNEGQTNQFRASQGSPASNERSSIPIRTSEDDGDEGLSMMTSALLTMLDTTEEGAPGQIEDDGPDDSISLRYPPSMSPHAQRTRSRLSPRVSGDLRGSFQTDPGYSRSMRFVPLESEQFSRNEYGEENLSPPGSLQQYCVPVFTPNNQRIPEPPIAVARDFNDTSGGSPDHWSPSWYGSPRDRQIQGTTAQTITMVQGQGSPHDSSHNVGGGHLHSINFGSIGVRTLLPLQPAT